MWRNGPLSGYEKRKKKKLLHTESVSHHYLHAARKKGNRTSLVTVTLGGSVSNQAGGSKLEHPIGCPAHMHFCFGSSEETRSYYLPYGLIGSSGVIVSGSMRRQVDDIACLGEVFFSLTRQTERKIREGDVFFNSKRKENHHWPHSDMIFTSGIEYHFEKKSPCTFSGSLLCWYQLTSASSFHTTRLVLAEAVPKPCPFLSLRVRSLWQGVILGHAKQLRNRQRMILEVFGCSMDCEIDAEGRISHSVISRKESNSL